MSQGYKLLLDGNTYEIIESAYSEIKDILKMPGVVIGASNEVPVAGPVNQKPTTTEEGRTEPATFQMHGIKYYGEEGLKMAGAYKKKIEDDAKEKTDTGIPNTDPPGTNGPHPETETPTELYLAGGTTSSPSE